MTWRSEPSPFGRRGSRLVTCEVAPDWTLTWVFFPDEVAAPAEKLARMVETIDEARAIAARRAERAVGPLFGEAA